MLNVCNVEPHQTLNHKALMLLNNWLVEFSISIFVVPTSKYLRPVCYQEAPLKTDKKEFDMNRVGKGRHMFRVDGSFLSSIYRTSWSFSVRFPWL